MAEQKSPLKPKYIKSTYNELESMGFTAYEITYSFPEPSHAEIMNHLIHWEFNPAPPKQKEDIEKDTVIRDTKFGKMTYFEAYQGSKDDLSRENEETLEIMSPWEDLDIIKKLYCKDNDLPSDEVEIISEREISIESMASECGCSMDDSINYIGEDDPYYNTL